MAEFYLVPTQQGKVIDHAVLYIPACSNQLLGTLGGTQYQYKWKPTLNSYTEKEETSADKFKSAGNIAWFSGNEKTSRYDVSWKGPNNRHCWYPNLNLLGSYVYSCGKVIDLETPGRVLGACKRGNDHLPVIACYGASNRIDFYQYYITPYSFAKSWEPIGSYTLPSGYYVSNIVFFSQDATKAVTYCIQKKVATDSNTATNLYYDYEYYTPHKILFTIGQSLVTGTLVDLTANLDVARAYQFSGYTLRMAYSGEIASEYVGNDLTDFHTTDVHYITITDTGLGGDGPKNYGLSEPVDLDITLTDVLDVFDAECKHAQTGIECWYYGYESHPPPVLENHDSTELSWLYVHGNFATSKLGFSTYLGTEGMRGTWDYMRQQVNYTSTFEGLIPWWLFWAHSNTVYPSMQHEKSIVPHVEDFVGRRYYLSRQGPNIDNSFIYIYSYLGTGIDSTYDCAGFRYEAGPGWGVTQGPEGVTGEYSQGGVRSFTAEIVNAATHTDSFVSPPELRNLCESLAVVDLQAGIVITTGGKKCKVFKKYGNAYALYKEFDTELLNVDTYWSGLYALDGVPIAYYNNIYNNVLSASGMWSNSIGYASDKFKKFMMNADGTGFVEDNDASENWINIGVI